MDDPGKRNGEGAILAGEPGNLLNLPNGITLVRIGILPVLFLLLWNPGRIWSLAIALLFIAAALTDLLDGYVARRYQLVTALGKFLDPIADKLIVNTAMIVMIPIGRVPAWVVAVTVIRDVVVDGIRSMAAAQGVVISASPLGKRKTLCQIFAVSALMIHYPLFGADAHTVGMVILYIALFFTVWSGMDYLVKFLRSMRQS